jgi:hypothetical protein
MLNKPLKLCLSLRKALKLPLMVSSFKEKVNKPVLNMRSEELNVVNNSMLRLFHKKLHLRNTEREEFARRVSALFLTRISSLLRRKVLSIKKDLPSHTNTLSLLLGVEKMLLIWLNNYTMTVTTLSSLTRTSGKLNGTTGNKLSPLLTEMEVKSSELLLVKVITEKLLSVKLNPTPRLQSRMVSSLLIGVDLMSLERPELCTRAPINSMPITSSGEIHSTDK